VKILRALGIKHPVHFLNAVWSSQWENAIDRLLNPHSLYVRPLELSDYHFKWALGAFNTLPQDVRARMFMLKIQPNGLDAPLKALFRRIGVVLEQYDVIDMQAVDKIHSEAVVTLRTLNNLTFSFELSHFALASEEIFVPIAELFTIPVEPIVVFTTPHGEKVGLELSRGEERLLSEHLTIEFFEAQWERIVQQVAEHDAFGDALGTINRDVHYCINSQNQVLSFHHRELFHEFSEYHYGFFEPVYLFVNRKLPQGFLGTERERLALLYRVYKEAYMQKNNKIRSRWNELEAVLRNAEALLQEYFGGKGSVDTVVIAVKARLFQNVEQWLDGIYIAFCQEQMFE
jgi:hypothetical protein